MSDDEDDNEEDSVGVVKRYFKRDYPSIQQNFLNKFPLKLKSEMWSIYFHNVRVNTNMSGHIMKIINQPFRYVVKPYHFINN